MGKLCLIILAMSLCPSVWADDGALPQGDQTLSVPITLAVKGESLSDIAMVLSKQAGAKLRVASDVADQKATIFVDKRPLADVMQGLATIFGYRWSMVKHSDGSKVYELWESASTKRAREEAAQGVLGAAWQEMDRRIREIARISPQERDKLRAELRALEDRRQQQGLTKDEEERLSAVRDRVAAAAPVAKVYAALPAEVIQALRSGCKVCFDTDTSESEWRLPRGVFAEIAALYGDAASASPPYSSLHAGRAPDGGCNACISFIPYRNQIWYHAFCSLYWTAKGSDPKMRMVVGANLTVTLGDAKPQRPETKLPSSPDGDALAKQVSFAPKELSDEAGLYGQTEKSPSISVNRSDVLSLLHKKLGLQSISDHHSRWFTWTAVGAQSVKHLLDHFTEMISESDRESRAGSPWAAESRRSDPMWGWDGSCLYMRERFPYEPDAIETPNEPLRRWRANLAEDHCLSLEDVAEMARLADGQARELLVNWDRLIKVKGVDYDTCDILNPSSRTKPALQLYSCLTDVQKRAVKAGGLPTASLRPDQYDILAKCVGSPDEDAGPAAGSGSAFTDDPAGRRVGIYRNGIRLDKPQADAMLPMAVRLLRRQSDIYNLTGHGSADRAQGPGTKAASPEDALQQFMKASPSMAKGPHFLGRDMGYVMLFTFADGTTRECPITLYEPVVASK